MSPDNHYLITLTDGESLFYVALKVPEGILKGDADEFFMEPENKEQFFNLLPLHCKNGFKIVEIKEIFEVVVALKP